MSGRGRFHNAPCPRFFFRCGSKRFVHVQHLPGMNTHLPAKAQAPGTQGISPHLLRPIYVRGDAIHRRLNARKTRNQYDLRTEIQKLIFRGGHAEIELEIDRAEYQTLNAVRAGHCQCIPGFTTRCRRSRGRRLRSRADGARAALFQQNLICQARAGGRARRPALARPRLSLPAHPRGERAGS